MKIQSIELISRYTQATSRNLLLLCGGVLVVQFYGLNASIWKIAEGKEVEPWQFKQIATIVVTFLAVSHLVHWISDYTTYSKWFQTNKIPTDSIDAIGSFSKSSEHIISGLGVRLKRLKELSSKIDEQVTAPQDLLPRGSASAEEIYDAITRLRTEVKSIDSYVSQVVRDSGEIKSVLEDIGPGFKAASSLAKFVVYVWYLAVPIAVYFLALWSLWCWQV